LVAVGGKKIMLGILVLVAALIVFVVCARKFGFRSALIWSALLVLSVFPLTLAAGFVSRPAHFLWALLSLKARIVTVVVVVVVAFGTVKEKGLGETLRWAFALAIMGSVIVFGFFLPILMALASQGAK
jgi:hypothetical protein